MLSMGSIFFVTIIISHLFTITYFSFIYTDTVKTIAFTLFKWKVYKRLWYYTAVRHYSTVQFGHHFIDLGWCNLGNQIKYLYAYACPI